LTQGRHLRKLMPLGGGNKSKEDQELKVQIFNNCSLMGNFEYKELFGNRTEITEGTIIAINERTFSVKNISLTIDRQIIMEVYGSNS